MALTDCRAFVLRLRLRGSARLALLCALAACDSETSDRGESHEHAHTAGAPATPASPATATDATMAGIFQCLRIWSSLLAVTRVTAT